MYIHVYIDVTYLHAYICLHKSTARNDKVKFMTVVALREGETRGIWEENLLLGPWGRWCHYNPCTSSVSLIQTKPLSLPDLDDLNAGML